MTGRKNHDAESMATEYRENECASLVLHARSLLVATDALLALTGHWTLDRRVLELIGELHAEATELLAKDAALYDPHKRD
jgi:hypothetical protein